MNTTTRAHARKDRLLCAGVVCIVAIAVSPLGAGCLDFSSYHLVNEPIGGFGGSTSTESGGFGGFGGAGGGGAAPCMPSTEDGTVTAAFIVPEGATPSASVCPLPTGAGVAIVAVDALDGSCTASALIGASAGTVLAGAPSVRFDRQGNAFVAGSFRKGTLTFPMSCAGASVSLDGVTGTTAALYFAELEPVGPTYCTIWANRAFTSDAGAAGRLHVDASAVDATGVFGVTGTLGPALVHFGDAGDTMTDLAGGPFFAAFDPFGNIQGLSALADAAPTDASLGLAASAGAWFATGAIQNARPQCHGCTGVDSVDGKQQTCGSGVGGGAGAGGGGGGAVDAPNAVLWQPSLDAQGCTITSYGSDVGDGDAQIGFGLAAADACKSYWTGLAGSASWGIAGVGLFAGAGDTEDAFVAQVDHCNGPDQEFTERFVPSISGATAFGHRVAPLACAGPVVSAVIEDAAGGRVDIHRCAGSGSSPCDLNPFEAPLASGATDQLLVTGFDGSGSLTWSGAIGPVQIDAAAAPLPGRARDDLAADDRGLSYVVLTTTGPLVTEHLDAGGCDLVSNTDPGTWLFALDGAGSSGKASCTWAQRLGP